MTDKTHPQPVPTMDLPSYFNSREICFQHAGSLNLGFGRGNDQYKLYPYPAPGDDETMGLFCELHTEDYFEVDTGPHIAIGLRGPVENDPHRGRGLAIGILASHIADPHNPDQSIALFKGCPPPPGGPSFFIEEFTINEGTAPIRDWQLSRGQDLPQLRGNGIYRLDIHVSKSKVWVGIWEVLKSTNENEDKRPVYVFLGQGCCTDDVPAYSGDPCKPCPQDPTDRGRGNAFIGTGFSDPDTRACIDNIYIAHWKTQG